MGMVREIAAGRESFVNFNGFPTVRLMAYWEYCRMERSAANSGAPEGGNSSASSRRAGAVPYRRSHGKAA